ncbi:uncharacterized protein LOC114574803 [Exaiptasia diaphana]|uniref:Uncharacterized protein n=1 Tax=Exaiptasia diaphana TaxID=2652724 RepID=A0A913YIF3_EXADI|nr:uncharacterized protein LOC114574803 [Exaiptasia diaphana]
MTLPDLIHVFVALLCTKHASSSTSGLRVDPYELYPDKRLQLPHGMEQKSIQVGDDKKCAFSCTTTEWCRSVNFKITPLENGRHVCELLSSDQFTNGANLNQNNSYLHYSKKYKSGGDDGFREFRIPSVSGFLRTPFHGTREPYMRKLVGPILVLRTNADKGSPAVIEVTVSTMKISMTIDVFAHMEPWDNTAKLSDKCRQEKPCRNGGQCIYYEDIHDYRCVCAQGTTGKDCEILEKFGIKESYLVKLALDGKDASLTPINGAKYENTDQGKALYLDGVNDFVLVPRFVFYDKNYTFGVWVKLAAFKRHSIISDDDGHNGRRSFNFRIGPGNKAMVVMYFGDGSTAISSTSNGIIPINQWTHIGATFDIDAHRVKIYLNGTLDKNHVGRSSVRNMCLYDTTSYWIGKVGYTNEDFFKGWMKDLSMISRVLQDSEMKALSDGERRAWIGLNDKANEGVLQWADESPMTYKNMKQLNTETRDCSAAILVENFPEEWSMRDCQEESFFICRK